MPDVDAIITRLREDAALLFYNQTHLPDLIPLADAEAAVLAAVDARTAEIVALHDVLHENASPTIHREAWLEGIDHALREIARRFPNGGTHDE